MAIRQQNYISRNTQHSFSTRTICGPFDTQFKRKFVGRQSSAINLEMKHVARQPSLAALKSQSWEPQTNLLPKIKEIEKISKISSKKKGKIHEYVDGVSDLELYIAKKLIDRQTTAEILSRIQQANAPELPPRRSFNHSLKKQNLPAKDITSVEDTNQEIANNSLNQKDLSESDMKAKTMSDREFVDKFDKFIVKKHSHDKPSVKDMLGGERRFLSEQIRQKITEDQEMLTTIVKRMINQRANFVEIDQEGTSAAHNEPSSQVEKKKQAKTIEWIIRECSRFPSRFKDKKFKNRRKVVSKPKT